MSYYNRDSALERETLPTLPDVSNPDWSIYYGRGWRAVVPFEAPAGYVAKPGTRRIEMDGDTAREVWDLWTQAEADAAAAAAEAARMETPIVYDQPLQAHIETPATDGHVYGIEVEPVTGQVVPVQRESERLSQRDYEAARAARFAQVRTEAEETAALKARLAKAEADLAQAKQDIAGLKAGGGGNR